ncbi:MAG TPA: 16S rRNA (cytosine(1402)-N(4))-methyltransferase [Chitinophagaceae bacterium]|nr:16S rRNA (cytosine(1402)-N(4))-methyltransferase [Chitinophagaceae bacterium]
MRDPNPAYHIPVLLSEAMDGLKIRANGVYVDCTFGGGGHSAEILAHLNPEGRLYGFDQDTDAGGNRLTDERFVFIPHNFRHLQRFLRLYGVTAVDGILADLGVSSHQFDEPTRGFSTRSEADLDMRMDKRQSLTAETILNTFDEQKLQEIFSRYGEVTNAKTLARAIVQLRSKTPFRSVHGFKQAVGDLVKGNPNRWFAQVFQALRIEVNDETGALREMLEQAPAVLKPGGRIVVISFHSLEDRMVKQFFRSGHFEEKEKDEPDPFGSATSIPPFRAITKKPVTPSGKELSLNPRARSAKLRIAEKI